MRRLDPQTQLGAAHRVAARDMDCGRSRSPWARAMLDTGRGDRETRRPHGRFAMNVFHSQTGRSILLGASCLAIGAALAAGFKPASAGDDHAASPAGATP